MAWGLVHTCSEVSVLDMGSGAESVEVSVEPRLALSGLEVANQHRFRVRACSHIGCGDARDVPCRIRGQRWWNCRAYRTEDVVKNRASTHRKSWVCLEVGLDGGDRR